MLRGLGAVGGDADREVRVEGLEVVIDVVGMVVGILG